MTFPEVPSPPEHNSAADVAQAERDAVSQRFQEEVNRLLADTANMSDKSGAPNLVSDHGQVSSMTMPESWVVAPQQRQRFNIGSRSVLAYHPPDNPDVMVALFYRGLPISSDGGQAFHQLLQEAPHALTDQEIKSQSEVLREKADPSVFSRLSASTQDMNGRRVLVVHGVYKNTGNELYDIFVDGDQTGRPVQEVMYQAPKDQYLRYLADSKAALKSIRWK